MQPLTDAQIDQLIDQQKPMLRTVLKSILSGAKPFEGVKWGDMQIPNGNLCGIYLYAVNEPIANLIGGTLQGFAGLNEALTRINTPKQGAPAAGANGVPQPPTSKPPVNPFA